MENLREQDWPTFEQFDEQSAVLPPVETDQRLSEAPVPAPTPDSLRKPSVALYVDADNQSAQCAGPLLCLFGQMLPSQVVEAVIAGNNHGKEIDHWRKSLIAQDSGIAVRRLDVPSRRQAADAALVMALGQDLEKRIREGDLVVVVSRDEFLIRAAEQAMSRGCHVLLAYAGGEMPVARTAELTTLVLPVVKGSETAPVQDSGAPPASPTPTGGSDPRVAATLTKLRETCVQQPGGGYAPSDVGQALTKLGYKKPKDRRRFLQSVPGLQERGTGAKKVLIF
jgi:hypothetical protein